MRATNSAFTLAFVRKSVVSNSQVSTSAAPVVAAFS